MESSQSRGKRVVVGSMFVVSLLTTVVLALSTSFSVFFSLYARHAPNEPVVKRAILIGVVMTLLCAFFAMVTKRLFAEWRGQNVEHVIPPWLAVLLALALPAGAIASMIVTGHYSYGAGCASVLFIGYAIHTMRWRLKRKPL